MLGRRILRIKVFKTLYACAENPGLSLVDAHGLLSAECESTRDLYLYMLSIIGPLTAEAEARIEAARGKFNPTEEERNPNLKFVSNKVTPLFADDPDFQKLIKKKKFSWENDDAFLRKLYETVRERDYFKKYMSSDDDSVAADAHLWIKIFEREFEDNPDLAPILEDMSIHWGDDLGYALGWCCRSLGDIADGRNWNLPPLFMSDITGSKADDSVFCNSLLDKAYAGFGRYRDDIAANVYRWKPERICMTDLALIVCGLAEHEAFPFTPVNVIINEYVEISKYYSTPESRSFVNGLLDKLINKN